MRDDREVPDLLHGRAAGLQGAPDQAPATLRRHEGRQRHACRVALGRALQWLQGHPVRSKARCLAGGPGERQLEGHGGRKGKEADFRQMKAPVRLRKWCQVVGFGLPCMRGSKLKLLHL